VWSARRTWIERLKIRLLNMAWSVLGMTERETTQAAADSMPTSSLNMCAATSLRIFTRVSLKGRSSAMSRTLAL